MHTLDITIQVYMESEKREKVINIAKMCLSV